jgi:hypothetical protein
MSGCDGDKREQGSAETAMNGHPQIRSTEPGDGTAAPRTAADVAAVVRAAARREPGLVALGIAGLAVSVADLIAVAARGTFIPPEGKMLSAATFAFGVAVFTLTMALLLPLAGFSDAARRRWRRACYVFPAYGFVLESVQSFRGLDPRFPGGPSDSDVGGVVDRILGPIFGMSALLLTVLFVILAVRFFRRDVLSDRPVLRLGIRYGAVAVAISFGIGIVMSIVQGRNIADAGDLMLAHALGVHGIQAVPLAALILVWGGPAPGAARWAHAAGAGWLIACTAALVQALLGEPSLEASALTAVMAAGLTLWASTAAYSAMAWRRAAWG